MLALVNLAARNSRTGVVIEERVFAGVVADNRAVEALNSAQPPALGETSGSEPSPSECCDGRAASAKRPKPESCVWISPSGRSRRSILSAVTIFRGCE